MNAAECRELCAGAGIEVPCCVQPSTLGQAAVTIGEAQKALDRLLENPGGTWGDGWGHERHRVRAVHRRWRRRPPRSICIADAKAHMRAVIMALASSAQLLSRVSSLEAKCNTSDLVAKAIGEAVECMQNPRRLAA